LKTRNTILWNVLFALALLLGAGAAQAQTVIFDTVTEPPDPFKAIGIDGLVVGETTYDVDFTARTNPQGAYGDFPGDLDFNDEASAAAAHAAVDIALTESVATAVGAAFNPSQPLYVVGYRAEEDPPNGRLYHLTSGFDVSWQRIEAQGEEFMPWLAVGVAGKAFALFTPVPEPGATLSMVAALATVGVIRRWGRKGSEGTV
jgi:hypothetical protein